jgi:hypothetical protein
MPETSRLITALTRAREMIACDRDIAADSFSIPGTAGFPDPDEAEVIAEYDEVLALIDVALAEPLADRDARQRRVGQWVRETFGSATMLWLDERAARVLEEAAELAQSLGVMKETADRVIGYVFSRPAGEPAQEAGGVGITLLACCEAMAVSADASEADELRRVLAKPAGHFERRQAEKRAAMHTPAIRSNDGALADG